MPLRRLFLPWDRPLLPQAVAHLAGDWRGEGPLDLSDLLAIVPTRQAGRRLREALAAHAAEREQAVFPPRVLTPESLLALGATGPVASKLDAWLAWTAVLRTADLAQLPDLFPVAPPARNFAWALRLAQEFSRLQAGLAEAGLRIADVPARVAGDGDFPETARWDQLAELERRHDAALRTQGLVTAIAAELAWGAAPVPPAGIARVVVVAAPDPLPRATAVLAAWAQTLAVELLVWALSAEAEAFDDFGRPRPEVWTQRALELPAFERHVHLAADPEAQAAAMAAVVARYARPDGLVAIGVADAEVTPLVADALARTGVASFDPDGRRWRDDGFFVLLSALAALAREPSFAAVTALARCPDLLAALMAEAGGAFSVEAWLSGLDDLHTRHLPPTLAEAQRHARGLRTAEVARGLGFIAELRSGLTERAFPDNIRAVLDRLFAGRRLDLGRPDDARLAEAAEAWRDVLTAGATAAARFGALDPAEGWELALELFADGRRGADKPDGALELQGWLELLWEDAPHLLVAGLNDGLVPDAVVGDVFLPERLRERLGLKTNAARFARDAYLLQALAASRRGDTGRLDLFFGKTSAAGDPLRPSRLLLACADEDLPARIAQLFRPVDAGRPAPAWRRAWTLAPPAVSPPPRVAVTGLRAWLECPFRFYLRRVLRMEPVDPAKTELDVMDFGTLCHAAFEALGRHETVRASTDAKVLRDFLVAELEAEAARRFGCELTLPLLVQLESARQRLGRLAEVQAEVRAEGWLIEAVERPFELDIAGLTVSGKIDRIERHETTGVLRVIDYKTSDRAIDPGAAHLRAARREETAPDFARVTLDGKEHVWTDLQLPLYLRLVAAQGAPVEAAYFNLPKAVSETRLCPWTGYTPELAAAAWRCAEGVAEAIRAGRFWPPNETIRPEWDDFAALFHHGVADSVTWEEAER